MGSEFYTKVYDPNELQASIPNSKSIFDLRDGEKDFKVSRLKHKNGQWVQVRRTLVVFERDAEGKPVTFLGVCEDITAQVEHEQEFNRQTQVFQAIVENIPVALFLKDAKDSFRITLWNKAAEQIFELAREHVLGKTVYDLWSKKDADKYNQDDNQVITSRIHVDVEEKSSTKNRGIIDLHTRKIPLQIGDSDRTYSYLLAICDDITQQKEAQVNLFHSSKMASLGEMAGAIAHEINNPLAIILGKTSQMKRQMEGGTIDSEKISQSLSKIEATAERVAKLIKGLLAFSRNADADPMQKVKISKIIEETLELCKERFRMCSIELKVNCGSEESILCRPSQISQVLMNLLGNSYDAIEPLEAKWVSMDVISTESQVTISVTDSGQGIRSEIVEKMMQPFFTTKEVGKGTGLGLSISRRIMADHQGVLRYDVLSKNTKFVMEFPITK